jgi:NAD(P)-dependent dehydrogenase (short-subunit alcohol dehydrogenase family)
MSADQDRNECLGPQGRGRRRFLTDAALATAAGSAAAMLPSVSASGQSGAQQGSAPRECAAIKPPMQDVEGKVAFITGGASGIGFGIAQAFVGAGMKVVLAGLSEERSKEALAHFAATNQASRVHSIRVDVTDRQALEKAAEESVKVFGKVHVLVNNAGISHPVKLTDTTYDDWDWMMGVNLDGVFNGIRAFLPRIQAQGEGGHIISTSSVLGLFATSTLGAYSASKFAVVGLMEALRAELADTNIGVSVYCPGPVIPNTMSSSLNRPKDLPNSTLKPDSQMIAREKEARRDPKVQENVLAAGQAVLRGMRENELHILTHPEYEPILRERCEVLLQAIPSAVTAEQTAAARTMVETSVYAHERGRQECAKATPNKTRGTGFR